MMTETCAMLKASEKPLTEKSRGRKKLVLYTRWKRQKIRRPVESLEKNRNYSIIQIQNARLHLTFLSLLLFCAGENKS